MHVTFAYISYPVNPSNTRTPMNAPNSETFQINGLGNLLVTYTGLCANDSNARERAATILHERLTDVVEPQVIEWLRVYGAHDQPPTGCHVSVHSLNFGLDIGFQFKTGINLPDSEHLVDAVCMFLGLHEIIETARQPQPEPIARIH